MSRKKTIGVFIGQIFDRYHYMLWPPIVQTAEKYGMNVLLFVGQALNEPVNFAAQENIIYSLAGVENIDGLLIASGSLGNFITDEEMERFVNRYKNIPLVNIARTVKDYASATIENYKGMYDLICHMIEVHGKKKIAFIRGPENNPEAQDRFRAYRSALTCHDIPYDQNLVVNGTFAGHSGASAVKELMDERRSQFDCLIAANDDMLLWALKVLKERGLRVPQDVAVGGFDNLIESLTSEPPLTTVEQPMGSLAAYATVQLINMIQTGETAVGNYTVPSALVIRNSCGCNIKWKEDETQPQDFLLKSSNDLKVIENILERKEGIIYKLESNLQSNTDYPLETLKEAVSEIVSSLLDDIQRNDHNSYLENTLHKFIGSIQAKKVLDFWYGIINRLQQEVLLNIKQGTELYFYLNLRIKKGYAVLHEQNHSIYNIEISKLGDTLWDIKRVTQGLSGTFEIDKIEEILQRELPRLKIKACNVSVYEHFQTSLKSLAELPSERSRLFFAYRGNNKIKLEKFHDFYNTRQLFPDELFWDTELHTWSIFPICFENTHLGFMSFDINLNADAILQDSLREHISSALRGAFLIQELKNTQGRLEEAVKTAETANYHKSKVLVNMSHELRTPLNAINGITELLLAGGYEKAEDLIDKLDQWLKYADNKLTSSVKDEELLKVQEEIRQYKTMIEKDINTKPFYFQTVREKLKAKENPDLEPLIEILESAAGILNEERKETYSAYKHIKDSGIYLLGLIDTVLNLSKVEAGKIEVLKTQVEIKHILNSVLSDSESYCRSIKKEHLIQIRSRLAENVPVHCMLDKQKTKEVLLNFISNSIKYTPQGEVNIEILKTDNMLVFQVTDNGLGIKDADKAKIFTEFGRTEESRKIEGTGLGLVLSKKLVEMQGGQIGFHSEHGKGSNFWFTIPLPDS